MTTHPQPGLLLSNIRLCLGGRQILSIDRCIAPGSVLTVMGKSGSGKSSLLNLVAGFLGRDFQAEGKVWLDGRDITSLPPQHRHIGLMFQTPLLFPHLSVLGNLLFALPPAIKGRRSRTRHAEKALNDVGLEGFGNRDPATLSGGQQTRVALMRLLLAEPRALLLDEPFSALDQALRADIRQLVFKKARERALPVLLVTHDRQDAEAAGGDLVTLDGNSKT
ncbi:ATP-binding cassette domain-containing protein [Roseibium sp. RKSG952]|uniref:ATP-binding cassette domain-containing protein n=1 Tax=Roseibium sp. RKSG952 TaxID=2529384 RepID=UPI0012BB6288|nr:ATP-binding cassette domain-containing protein [Roseibium sp. RKSG952]MTH97467.1 ATP-binding cassette domain-containing protein [Roseibium sp. RKSG952]